MPRPEGRGMKNQSILMPDPTFPQYKGKCRLADNNQVIATVDVENYTGKPNSVLGLLRSYRLILSGVAAPQSFTLSGQVEGQPQLIISIELTKIGELVA